MGHEHQLVRIAGVLRNPYWECQICGQAFNTEKEALHHAAIKQTLEQDFLLTLAKDPGRLMAHIKTTRDGYKVVRDKYSNDEVLFSIAIDKADPHVKKNYLEIIKNAIMNLFCAQCKVNRNQPLNPLCDDCLEKKRYICVSCGENVEPGQKFFCKSCESELQNVTNVWDEFLNNAE